MNLGAKKCPFIKFLCFLFQMFSKVFKAYWSLAITIDHSQPLLTILNDRWSWSIIINDHQWSSLIINEHQCSSMFINAHQWSSMIINEHQYLQLWSVHWSTTRLLKILGGVLRGKLATNVQIRVVNKKTSMSISDHQWYRYRYRL